MEEINEDGLAEIEPFGEDGYVPDTTAEEVSTGAFGLGTENTSEDAVARYFLHRHAGNFLWVHDSGAHGELGAWYGSRWGIGGTRVIDACISDICQELSRSLSAPDPESKRMDYRQKLLASRYQQGVRHIVLGHLGKAGATCVSVDEFNVDPWVIGTNPITRNSKTIAQVIDQRTGTIMESGRDARLTGRLRIPVDFTMPTPIWDKYLLETMSGEQDRVDFMEALGGYSLTGAARHEIVIMLGSPAESDESSRGRNGKGTFTKVLVDLAGSYGTPMGSDVIVRGKHSEVDKKRIYGAFDGRRVITLSETNESAGEHVDNSFLKELSGGDGGSGCDVYQPRKHIRQTWTLWFAVNGIPVLENTVAMRKRIIYIAFKEKFVGARCNEQLKEQLQAEYPGILGRLIRAGANVYQHGLHRPASVVASSAAVFTVTDYGARFCTEMLEKGCGEDFISNPEMTDAYREYVQRVGEAGADWANTKSLARTLTDRGGLKGKRGPRGAEKWGWMGLRFNPSSTS